MSQRRDNFQKADSVNGGILRSPIYGENAMHAGNNTSRLRGISWEDTKAAALQQQQQQQQQRELCMSSGAEPFVESSKSVLRLHQGGREGGMGTSSRSPSSQETVAGLRLRARTLA